MNIFSEKELRFFSDRLVSLFIQLDAKEGKLTSEERTLLAHTLRAQKKITEGSYGQCDDCSEKIPPGHLRRFPESIFCSDCSPQTETILDLENI